MRARLKIVFPLLLSTIHFFGVSDLTFADGSILSQNAKDCKEDWIGTVLSRTDAVLDRKDLSYSQQIEEFNKIQSDLVENELFKSLPKFESTFLALSDTILEEMIWSEVEVAVWEKVKAQLEPLRPQVSDETWGDIKEQAAAQVLKQLGHSLRYKVRNPVKKQIEDEIGRQFWNRTWYAISGKVGDRFRSQFEVPIGQHIAKNLEKFALPQAYLDGNLNEMLEPAIHYAFLVNQLASILMRHSEYTDGIRTDLLKNLSNLRDEKAKSILSGIKIPESKDPLIHIQLKLLGRNLK